MIVLVWPLIDMETDCNVNCGALVDKIGDDLGKSCLDFFAIARSDECRCRFPAFLIPEFDELLFPLLFLLLDFGLFILTGTVGKEILLLSKSWFCCLKR